MAYRAGEMGSGIGVDDLMRMERRVERQHKQRH
jgi:hypothetical protein